MFSETQAVLLGTLAAASGFYVGVMFLSVGRLFKDKMILQLGLAMVLIALSRGALVNLGIDVDNLFWQIVILAARGLAAYLLVIGSLNGDLRYKETKMWLAAALIVSAIVGIHDEETFIFSYTLAVSAGWVFAADRFWSRCGFWDKRRRAQVLQECDGTKCHPYCALGVLFMLRALLTFAGGIFHANPDVITFTYTLGPPINLAMIPYIFRIGFCRHRVAMDCDRELLPTGGKTKEMQA